MAPEIVERCRRRQAPTARRASAALPRARTARGVPLSLAAVLLLLAACGGDGPHHDTTLTAPARSITSPDLEWEVREPQVEVWIPRGVPLEALGFGSGGGLTALVVGRPRGYYQFGYSSPALPTGSWGRKAEDFLPILRLADPTDVVGVTADGIALYLDASTGVVKASTPSRPPVVLTALDTNTAVQSACALDAGTIAFIEGAHADTVFLRSMDADSTRALVLAPDSTHQRPPNWSDARLAGSMGSGCALWAPGWRHVVTLSDSARHLEWITPTAGAPRRWYRRALSFISTVILRRPPRPLARDATMVPGATAILSRDGDIVDVYATDDGRYFESVRLRRPALRIAGAGPRLFALSQSGDSIFLASYVLPASVRRQSVAAAAGDSAVPAWLRAFREMVQRPVGGRGPRGARQAGSGPP